MSFTKDELLSRIREGKTLDSAQKIKLTILLSLPAILAQLSSMLMRFIDASMIGKLGSNQAASIGLVSTTTWLIDGFALTLATGFSVQIAHRIGAKDMDGAKNLAKQGFLCVAIFSCLLGALAASLSPLIPHWLGGEDILIKDATNYLFINSICLPFGALGWASGAMLQASGNMKTPSIVYAVMCGMDVIYNYIFIFMLNLGVAGAAIGTGLAELTAFIWISYYLFRLSKELNIKGHKGNWIVSKNNFKKAMNITSPLWLQNVIMRGAHILSTIIIAPLGPIAIAANSFAIIAEGFCYLPGFGIQDASTTLVGQSLGAKRKDFAKDFAKITVSMGAILLTICGTIMFILAPELISLMSNDAEVIAMGAKVLRIEAFAETMFGVAIVGYGACVGAGDTLVPTIINFCTMWFIRIVLAAILVPKLGLTGFWIGMCIDLNVRGLLFIWRLKSGKWMKHKKLDEATV